MEIDDCIRENIPWSNLSPDIKVIVGNSSRKYEKRVVEYSLQNQLRYEGNLVRHVKKNEEAYYKQLLRFSESHLMPFPYHLADFIATELRISPFSYYVNILSEMLNTEKSYDSLPNFTAADAMRLLGIGRNQYIELMNQTRSNRKFLRRSKTAKELLPQKPAKMIIESWWMTYPGSILESDVKSLSPDEKDVIYQLLDNGATPAGLLKQSVVTSLYDRGLIYFNVPVEENDYVYVAPLDGFVVNRVLGDYFETLLYKIFVAIDDQTTVAEMSSILHINIELVKNAISLFCRLGFAKKRVTAAENRKFHASRLVPSAVSPVSHMELRRTLLPTDDDDTEKLLSPTSENPALRASSIASAVNGLPCSWTVFRTVAVFLIVFGLFRFAQASPFVKTKKFFEICVDFVKDFSVKHEEWVRNAARWGAHDLNNVRDQIYANIITLHYSYLVAYAYNRHKPFFDMMNHYGYKPLVFLIFFSIFSHAARLL